LQGMKDLLIETLDEPTNDHPGATDFTPRMTKNCLPGKIWHSRNAIVTTPCCGHSIVLPRGSVYVCCERTRIAEDGH
jgi:hypothetical protein